MTFALILLAAYILAGVVRELCFKQASGPLDTAVASHDWKAAAANGLMWTGIAIWLVETLVWIGALKVIPLGIAYPTTALGYALVPLCSWWLLDERLSRSQMLGVLLVAAGAACVGLSGY